MTTVNSSGNNEQQRRWAASSL